MASIDQSVLHFFTTVRYDWLTFIALMLTYSGSAFIVSIVTILSSISFLIHRHHKYVFGLVVSVIGSSLTVYLLKIFFAKMRPAAEALYLEPTFSFPSGHSAAAIALYGFLLCVVWVHQKHPLKNPLIIILLFLIPALGISRLYLGVHYFSDVLVGYSVGALWLFISFKLLNGFRPRQTKNR